MGNLTNPTSLIGLSIMKINSSAATTKIKVWSKSRTVTMKAGEYLLILPDREKSEILFLDHFNKLSGGSLLKFSAIAGKFSLSIPDGSPMSESSSGSGAIFECDIADLNFTRKGETLDERAFGGQAPAKPMTPEEELQYLRAKLAAAPVAPI